nr:unnamed protein product [Callosobruchus analis]
MFRLTKDLTRRLINIVSPHVESPRRASALTIETKVRHTCYAQTFVSSR